MFFDQLPIRKIPIWANSHRLKLLRGFRVLLAAYVELIENTTTSAASPAARHQRQQIEQSIEPVRRMLRLAGISAIISAALRQEIFNRWPKRQISEPVDLLDAFFILDIP